MKFKNRDEHADFFCEYLQFRGERGQNLSLKDIGWQLEQASWVADVLLGLFWVLTKKKLLSKADLKEIFWHGKDEETSRPS